MASEPLISVIIPTLNCREDIIGVLDSICSQTMRNIEVIISDGGSTDGTLDSARSYLASRDVLFAIIEQYGSTIYGAMNLAMKIARGAWLYFIGADDRLVSSVTFQSVGAYLRISKYNVVYGSVYNSANNGLVMGGKYSPIDLGRMSIPHQAIFYRRSFLSSCGLHYNESYPIEADWDLSLRLWLLTKFEFVDLIIARYGGHGLSSPSRNPETPFKDNLARLLLDRCGLFAFLFLPSYRLKDACMLHPNPFYKVAFSIIRFYEAVLRGLKFYLT